MGWVFPVLIAVLIATSLKSAIADWNVVPSGSMKPTIVEGDRIFINKLAYDLKIPYTTRHLAKWKDPQRGDIVVFFSPEDEKRMVKRVVGLPGDVIAMKNNHLYINGEQLHYEATDPATGVLSYGTSTNSYYFYTEDLIGRKHPVMITPYQPAVRSFAPISVPDKHFFMMGDNRDNSADSRYFGFVDRKRIVGQALSVVASLDINNFYRPRWKRFFTKLL
ncbi:MAG: signal peptidase I [Desulfobacteraceae bacterium]|nr:signal peptidase I [Desulfobacteraceae bacterium]